jgi:hypothetical protein
MSEHEHGDWCEVGDEYKGYRIECGHCDATVDEVVGSLRADLACVTAERDALEEAIEQALQHLAPTDKKPLVGNARSVLRRAIDALAVHS